jgi:hypothetical protein
MKQFDYKIVDTRDVEAYLCSLGTDGWELVNVDFRELEGGLEFAGIMKKERQ